MRRGGHLEPAGWDEALGLVASTWRRIIAAHGPDAIAAISSARATNEENYLVQKLMRPSIGTNNVDNCARLCHAPSAAGLSASFGLAGGTNALEDIRTLGRDPAGRRQPDRSASGRRRTPEADGASMARGWSSSTRARPTWRGSPTSTCEPRPGTNVAVFNGLARLLLEERPREPGVPG